MPQKKEDYITNKVLIVFSVCLCGVLALMALTRVLNVGSTYAIGMAILHALMVVSVIGVIVGAVKLAQERKKQIDNTYRLFTGRNIMIVFAVALVILAIVNHFGTPVVKVFYAALPALAVYYLVYHSYQPEFFMIAVDCGLAAFLLLLTRWLGGPWKYIAVVVMAVVCLVQLGGVSKVRKAHDSLTLGGHTFDFAFGKNGYLMMQLTPVVMLVLTALGALLGPTASVCALAAAGGYAFVTAVYYTVKLM